MKILHITDFHYKYNNYQKEGVVKSIIETIKNKLNLKIDLVLFTGDLVQNGSYERDFLDAQEVLINPIIEKLSVPQKNIIFCPGNHDIDRTRIHSAIGTYIDSNISSEEELNSFLKTSDVYNDSLKPSENYKKFITNYFNPSDTNEDIIDDLYSIHYRSIYDKKIAIVSLNSAWLSAIDKEKNGKKDKGNLLFPSSLVREIKQNLDSSKLFKKIVIIHHPLYFLKDFNLYEIESSIHNNFDMMLTGHVHKVSSMTRYSGSNGIFEHVSKASLSSSETLGCSIIELDDVEENKIHVMEMTYIDSESICHVSEPVMYTIPCGSEKQEMISFRKKIFDKVNVEKENANNLLLLNIDDRGDFLTLYKNPILKKEPEDALESKNVPQVTIDEILNSRKNYVVLGKDKCGKSSLLRKLQLDCLINYSRNSIIPFYLDCKDLSSIDHINDLEQCIKTYFEMNKSKTKSILSSDNFILLLDNYSPNSVYASVINDFLLKYPKITFVACAEYSLSMRMEIFEFGGLQYEKIYHYDLRRQEIIAYTDNRLHSHTKKVEIQNKIIQLCKQLELPLNYWTVSLLLLIYNKSSDSYSKNLFSILDVCVDEIFGKKKLLLSNSKISFEQLKNICARLAKFLFEKQAYSIYSAPYSTILKFIEEEIEGMLRVNANGKNVLDFFIACGMLKYKDSNSLVFRLNGFFEYFLALQMTKDNEFKDSIINDDAKYLAFKNQLEIYSGFKRNDVDLLNIVYCKTSDKIDEIFKPYSDKDKMLKQKVDIPKEMEEFCRTVSVAKALSTSEIAKIEDISNELDINADVHLIEKINPNEISSEVIERYLSILARVFKNLDEVDLSEDKISKLFNYIIEAYCDFGFFVIDELTAITIREIETESDIDFKKIPELELLKLISGFGPVISQTWLSDGVGHLSLEKIIISEIEKLEEKSSQNQYKLFLLYFLLLDIDLKSNRQYIEKSLENLKIPVLKYAIYVKLNYYLVFKSGEDKVLQKSLSNLVQRAQLNLDSKTNVDDMQKGLQEKKSLATRKDVVN